MPSLPRFLSNVCPDDDAEKEMFLHAVNLTPSRTAFLELLLCKSLSSLGNLALLFAACSKVTRGISQIE
jgi:hypothetical protein